MADFNIRGKLTGFNDIEKGFDSINSSANETNETFTNLSKIAKGAAAIGIAAVSAAVVSGAKDLLTYGDQVQKLSTRLGVSTKALSEYKLVADLTGVSTQTLSTAWQRQTRRISEASQGTGVAVKALDELGISVGHINRMKPDEQFELLADALNGVSNQSDKVRLAMQIWDTEGVALLQTVEGGSAALQEMRDWSEKLGLSLSQESADSIAGFNDSVTLMKGAFDGLIQKSLVALLPMLEDLGEIFFDAAIKGDGFTEAAETLTLTLRGLVAGAVIVKNIIDALASSFASTAAAAVLAAKGEFQAAWNALKEGGKDVQNDFNDVSETIDKLFLDANESVKKSSFEIVQESKAAAKERENVWAIYNENLLLNEKAATDELAANMKIYEENLEKNNEAILKEIEENWAIYNASVTANNEAAYNEWQTGMDLYAENVKINNEAIKQYNENAAEVSKNHFESMFDAFSGGLEESVGSTEGWATRFKNHTEDMQVFASNAFDTLSVDFGNNIANMIVDGESFSMEETFKAMAKQFIAMIVTITAQWAIFTALVDTGAVTMAAAGTTVNIAWAPFLLTIGAIAAAIAAAIFVFKEMKEDGVETGNLVSTAFLGVKVILDAINLALELIMPQLKFMADIAGTIIGVFDSIVGGIGSAITSVTDFIGLTSSASKQVAKISTATYDAQKMKEYKAEAATKVIGDTYEKIQGLEFTDPNRFLKFEALREQWFETLTGMERAYKDFVTDTSGTEDTRNVLAQYSTIDELLKEVAPKLGIDASKYSIPNINVGVYERYSENGRGGTRLVEADPLDIKFDVPHMFATGGSFLTQGPQMFVAGERGQERITVDPAGTTRSAEARGQTNIFNGPVIMDYVTSVKFARGQLTGLTTEASRVA